MEKMGFKLTEKLKQDWLCALKSGEFVQHKGELRNRNNHKELCCLGVLATIHPEMEIDDSNDSVLYKGQSVKYWPFIEMGVHHQDVCNVADVNDKSYNKGIRDYSEVIPIIEKLKTEE